VRKTGGLDVAEVRPDRGGQPQQTVDVDRLDPAQVHQHLRLHHPVDAVVVPERGLADRRAVGVPPLCEPQGHIHAKSLRMR